MGGVWGSSGRRRTDLLPSGWAITSSRVAEPGGRPAGEAVQHLLGGVARFEVSVEGGGVRAGCLRPGLLDDQRPQPKERLVPRLLLLPAAAPPTGCPRRAGTHIACQAGAVCCKSAAAVARYKVIHDDRCPGPAQKQPDAVQPDVFPYNCAHIPEVVRAILLGDTAVVYGHTSPRLLGPSCWETVRVVGDPPSSSINERMACSSRWLKKCSAGGHTTRGDQGHLMLGERIAPYSEVIRAMVLEDSPCCGGPQHLSAAASPSSEAPGIGSAPG